MFDFDPGKLLIIGVVALIVIGPKDLPRVLRTVGGMVRRMRRMAGEFQSQFMEAMNEADLADVKKELNALHESAKVDMSYNPATAVRDEISTALEEPKVEAPKHETPAIEAEGSVAPPIASVTEMPVARHFAEPEHAATPSSDQTTTAAQEPSYDLVRKSVGDSRG